MSIDRYALAFNHEMSSIADIKAFAHDILLSEGVDATTVNIAEDGVTIHSFSKLVKALYMAGYKDGLEQNANLIGERKRMEMKGKLQTKHRRVARYMAETNQLKHI